MNLFSYVVRVDDGNAPNPYGGFLTLTVCKPRIRKHARKGDILIGTGSARSVGTGTLVYAAVISDVIPIEDYGKLAKYRIKRPSGRRPWWRQLGDNLYVRVNGRWRMRKNPFHSSADMSHDLSGVNALICREFWYFGRAAPPIPPSLQEIVKSGRGHRRIRDTILIDRVERWLEKMPRGRHDEPYDLDNETFVTGCAVRNVRTNDRRVAGGGLRTHASRTHWTSSAVRLQSSWEPTLLGGDLPTTSRLRGRSTPAS